MSDQETHLNCFRCLEDTLLFVDVGFSESTAMFLAGSKHVCKDAATFQKHAKEHFLSRWRSTQEPRQEPGRAYPWQ